MADHEAIELLRECLRWHQGDAWRESENVERRAAWEDHYYKLRNAVEGSLTFRKIQDSTLPGRMSYERAIKAFAAAETDPQSFIDDVDAAAPVAVQEEGDAKDGARYRWLRNPETDLDVLAANNWARPGGSGEVYTGTDLDDAIDAAMKGDQP